MFNDIFIPEVVGTALLTLLGCGVVANVALGKTKGNDGGYLLVTFGWGFGVFAGVYAAYKSGGHLNPAVTLGLLASGDDFTVGQVLTYISAQLVGAFLGAVVCWLSYRDQFNDSAADAPTKLGVFSTAPEIRRPTSNVLSEVIGTFVLVFVVVAFGRTPSGLGPLAVALLVVGIGASLGGPTGYAINPARDLGPRIAHAVLPIAGKGSSDWGYSWVPIVGPIIGGVVGGALANALGYV